MEIGPDMHDDASPCIDGGWPGFRVNKYNVMGMGQKVFDVWEIEMYWVCCRFHGVLFMQILWISMER